MASITPVASVPVSPPDRPAVSQLRTGDPLRALAALSVLVYHVVTVALAGDTLADGYGAVAGPLLGTLNLGLHMFFALTGYLLGRPFLHAFINGTTRPSILRYARNRALRILPAFWILTTLSLVVLGTAGANLKQVVAMYGLFQLWVSSDASERLFPAWSLHPEAIFYVVLPIGFLLAVLVAGRRLQRSQRGWLVASVIGAIWLSGLVVLVVGPPIAYTVCAFVPGLALAAAEVWMPARLSERPTLSRRLPWLLLAASIPPLVGYAFVTEPASRAVFASLVILALLASVLVPHWSASGAPRALDNGVFHWLGVRAYSIYLLHYYVLLQVNDRIEVNATIVRALLLGLLVIPITVAGAYVSFRFFEQPFLRRRIRSAGTASRSPQPALRS